MAKEALLAKATVAEQAMAGTVACAAALAAVEDREGVAERRVAVGPAAGRKATAVEMAATAVMVVLLAVMVVEMAALVGMAVQVAQEVSVAALARTAIAERRVLPQAGRMSAGIRCRRMSPLAGSWATIPG